MQNIKTERVKVQNVKIIQTTGCKTAPLFYSTVCEKTQQVIDSTVKSPTNNQDAKLLNYFVVLCGKKCACSIKNITDSVAAAKTKNTGAKVLKQGCGWLNVKPHCCLISTKYQHKLQRAIIPLEKDRCVCTVKK